MTWGTQRRVHFKAAESHRPCLCHRRGIRWKEIYTTANRQKVTCLRCRALLGLYNRKSMYDRKRSN